MTEDELAFFNQVQASVEAQQDPYARISASLRLGSLLASSIPEANRAPAVTGIEGLFSEVWKFDGKR